MSELTVYIYVDESGSLSDPYNATVTLAAIKTLSPEPLRRIIKRAKRDVRRKRPKRGTGSEFKFYTTTNNARALVLEALAKEAVEVFALSVFKGSQVIPHSPENYGILLCELLRMCGVEQAHHIELSVDMPFNVSHRREQLTAIVCNTFDVDTKVHYVDSIKNPYIQLADFVAGAIRAKHMGRNLLLYQFIQPRMIGDQLVPWKVLRREWMEKTWQK